LELLHLFGIYITGSFVGNSFHHVVEEILNFFVLAAQQTAEIFGKIYKPDSIIVKNGNTAGSLVGYMHLVPLIHQTQESASHGNHVVVRMWTEDNHPLGERFCTFGALAVVGIGLAAGPAGNGML